MYLDDVDDDEWYEVLICLTCKDRLNPKSAIFAIQSSVTSTFIDFKSEWPWLRRKTYATRERERERETERERGREGEREEENVLIPRCKMDGLRV